MVPLLSQRSASAAPRARAVLRAVLAVAYLAAGVLHVAVPGPFLSITPAFVPFPKAVILVTGLCEIAGAVGLYLPRWRWWAGVMLALYAVCVYPANIKHALDYIEHGTGGLSLWYHVPRLLFQPVIVWWALFAGGVIDWPFKRRSSFR